VLEEDVGGLRDGGGINDVVFVVHFLLLQR
jgi:hypothetical protein